MPKTNVVRIELRRCPGCHALTRFRGRARSRMGMGARKRYDSRPVSRGGALRPVSIRVRCGPRRIGRIEDRNSRPTATLQRAIQMVWRGRA